MPTIPLKMSERSAMVGAPDRSYSDVKANAGMFGGGAGEAFGDMGRGLASAVAGGVEAYRKDEDTERAQKVAIDAAQTDVLTPSMQARRDAPADGSGVKDKTWQAQYKIVEDHIAEHYVGDPKGADAYRRQMLPQMAHIRNSNITYEFQQKDTYDKTQADNGLNMIYNKVRIDPTMYDDAIRQGHTLIDNSQAINAADKGTAKTVFSQKLAATTIEGQLNAAKTIDEVKTIQAQLGSNIWQERIASGDFARITSSIDKQLESVASTRVNKALDEVYNNTRTDPGSYERALRAGNGIIDASDDLSAVNKANAKVLFEQKLAATAVEGHLSAGKTVAEINAVNETLLAKGNEWQSRMSAEDYRRVVAAADTQKKTMQTKVMSAAKTELSTLRIQTDDPAAPPIPPERLENVRRTIESAGSETDTTSMAEFVRLQRDEQLKASARGLPAYQIAGLANASKGGVGQAYPNLPPDMSENINRVAKLFPGVSPGYLGATATLEYGGKFKKDGTTDYGFVNKGSNGLGTATGVYQFIDETWDEVTSNPGVKAVLKANGFDNITPELRKNPLASTIAAAALASQNKSALTAIMHRDISDSELYMAHFMGAEGAAKFLTNYVTNRDAPAASVLPGAAAANKEVFYAPGGRPRTVAQVYDMFTTRFVASPSQIAYNDSKTYEKIYKGAAQAQTENPVGYAASHGTHVVTPLDQPGAFEARGATFRDIGTYYRIPDADNKPLDSQIEVPQLKKTLMDGTPEQVAQLLANIGSMDKSGAGASAAALKQLGEKDTAYGVAAQLMQGSAPDMAVATAVIRGQKIVKSETGSPALGEKNDASDAFNKLTGNALSSLDAGSRDAIFAAAKAHYAETARTDKFDKTGFTKSVNAVMGGGETGRVGTINSAATVLPKGVTENALEKAVDNLKPQDLIAGSVDRKGQPNGMAPVYGDGALVRARDVSNQGRLRYVGADTYQIQMPDNKFLVTQAIDPSSGTPEPYRIKLDKDRVKELAVRTRAGAYDNMGGVVP